MNGSRVWQLGMALAVVLLLDAAWQTFAVLSVLPERLHDIRGLPAGDGLPSTRLVVFFGSEVFSILGYWSVAAFVWLASIRLGDRSAGGSEAGPAPDTVERDQSARPRTGATAGKPRHRMPSPPAA